MHFSRHKQLLLFLAVLALPTLAIAIQGRRIANQSLALAEKQREEAHRRKIAEIGVEWLSLLEYIKQTEIAREPASSYHDPAMALVAKIDEDGLRLPWDNDSATDAVGKDEADQAFLAQVAEAERAEFRAKGYARAATIYKGLAESAPAGPRRAAVQLAQARVLARAGAVPAAIDVYHRLLKLPSSVSDEDGLPIASYAANRLIDLGVGGFDVLDRVNQDLALPTRGRLQLYRLRSVLEHLEASNDPQVGEGARAALIGVADRVRDMEQAERLQRKFRTLTITETEWRQFPDDELWLVSKASRSPESSPVVIAVRAEAVRARTWLAAPGPHFRIAMDDSGELLNARLPDLRITLDADGNPDDDGRPQQQSFYGLSLASVTVLTLLAAWLLWRDTRREKHMAELRTQFVSSVSHELKTPLTSIRMFADILRTHGPVDPRMQTEYLETISNESERLTRLLNNVLDFSRIERGQKAYRNEPTPLAEVVLAVARTMRYPLSEQGFELELEVEDGMPPVPADRDSIQQAILNLLTNAMKYSGDRRDITLRLRQENESALIQVVDRGIGISPGEQARIFEKFYRAPIAENGAISGTGLGLALVAHIVEAHGGNVQVESRLGEGSTFSIRLPFRSNGGAV